MFENCKTMEELNAERHKLKSEGIPIAKINSAYNQTKKRLLEMAVSYRKIPSYTGTPGTVDVYAPFPIYSSAGIRSTIVITEKGVQL